MVNDTITDFIQTHGDFNFAICNAGIRSRISIEAASLDIYRDVFETNTLSQINIIKHLAFMRSDSDCPLNILVLSSIVGQRGFSDLSSYAVSKSALEGFVKSAAIELAEKSILINSLNPGFAKSSYEPNFRLNNSDLYQWTINQTPLKRWGECDEIAELALFLTSPKNTYMTGSVIYCDGGWTSK